MAFTDELLRIKLAEEGEREPATKREMLRSMGNFALGAIPYGVGMAGAQQIASRLTPNLYRRLPPAARLALMGSGALLSGIGTMAFREAMARNREMTREPR
jgi:hypothetical protein